MRTSRVPRAGPDVPTGREPALVRRIRQLPRERAPARLRRRILAAIAADAEEMKEREATDDARHGAGDRTVS